MFSTICNDEHILVIQYACTLVYCDIFNSHGTSVIISQENHISSHFPILVINELKHLNFLFIYKAIE